MGVVGRRRGGLGGGGRRQAEGERHAGARGDPHLLPRVLAGRRRQVEADAGEVEALARHVVHAGQAPHPSHAVAGRRLLLLLLRRLLLRPGVYARRLLTGLHEIVCRENARSRPRNRAVLATHLTLRLSLLNVRQLRRGSGEQVRVGARHVRAAQETGHVRHARRRRRRRRGRRQVTARLVEPVVGTSRVVRRRGDAAG